MSDRESYLQARAALFVEGNTAGSIYELMSGVVRLSRMSPHGRREIMGFVFPGELFSSSGFGLTEPKAATCTADAVTSIRVTAHPWNTLDDLLVERPDFVRKMLATVRRGMFHAQQQMLLLGRMSALERVGWFLLMMAQLQNTERDAPLYLPMPWNDIADYLGITTEAVSRVFFQLRRSRLVELEDASTVRIVNWRSMRLLAWGTRQHRDWWSRQLAEALCDLSDQERRIFLERTAQRDRQSLRALSQAHDISADRMRQIQVQTIGKLQQRAATHLEG